MKKILEIQNFLATRFVCLVLAGLIAFSFYVGWPANEDSCTRFFNHCISFIEKKLAGGNIEFFTFLDQVRIFNWTCLMRWSEPQSVTHLSIASHELVSIKSSLGRYVFGSEISYNKAPPRLPGLGC